MLLHPYFNFDDATFSATDFFNDPAVKLTTSIYKNLGKVHENTANYDEVRLSLESLFIKYEVYMSIESIKVVGNA